ncbi:MULTISPECIES: hypothetical protein [unclassified Pseudomonas]|uniref:hypothetical protein n=1 Tax=unclassified Pseudomonas TaxID=196821 RepID=UPI000D34F597|nr:MULTISPECIES: hypothetical protein [unclassified Pseudomonas]PTT12153.1 hypothetical protein DBR14_11235 [Pseudomonas sp. HMWF034]PVV73599.1 hypothetical protein DD985_09010 [Pseudomonas sp. HMWF011]
MAGTNQEQAHDRNFQALFGAARKVLEAVEIDESKSRRATDALRELQDSVEKKLVRLEAGVKQSIESSAQSTANQAAELLSKRFTEADAAARRAAELYNRAAKKLNSRRWLYFLSAQATILALVVVSLYLWVPSLDEIKARRVEVARLDELASKVEWSKCIVENGQTRDCIRTDESEHKDIFGDRTKGKTYRIPKGY